MRLLDRIAAWCVPDRIAPTSGDELDLFFEGLYLEAMGKRLPKTPERRILISAKDAPVAVAQWQAWVGEANNRYVDIWH